MFKPDDVNKEFRVVEKTDHSFEVGQLVQLATYVNSTQGLFTDLTGCITQYLYTSDVTKTKSH
jgi:hypothetical protein